jgi:hypothetical protein
MSVYVRSTFRVATPAICASVWLRTSCVLEMLPTGDAALAILLLFLLTSLFVEMVSIVETVMIVFLLICFRGRVASGTRCTELLSQKDNFSKVLEIH